MGSRMPSGAGHADRLHSARLCGAPRFDLGHPAAITPLEQHFRCCLRLRGH
jgi:hypothetical protein